MWYAIEEKSSCNLKHKRGFPLTGQVSLVLVCKLAPKRTRRDGKKDTDYPRLVGGRFNKQESLQTKHALGGCKTSRSPHQILRVYVGPWTGFSQVSGPNGLSNTMKRAATVGTMDRMYIPTTGERVRNLWLPGFSSWVNRGLCPLNDPLQHVGK